MNKYVIHRVEPDNSSEIIGTPKKAFFWVDVDECLAVCNMLNKQVCKDSKHRYEVRPLAGNDIKTV